MTLEDVLRVIVASRRWYSVALDLRQMAVLVAWQHIDGGPKASPAVELAGSHVGGNQAGGGADNRHVITPE